MDCENVFKQEMLVSKGRGTKLDEWMDVTKESGLDDLSDSSGL